MKKSCYIGGEMFLSRHRHRILFFFVIIFLMAMVEGLSSYFEMEEGFSSETEFVESAREMGESSTRAKTWVGFDFDDFLDEQWQFRSNQFLVHLTCEAQSAGTSDAPRSKLFLLYHRLVLYA